MNPNAPPSLLQRFLRGITGLLLSFFLWSACCMQLPYSLSFHFVDEPLTYLGPVGVTGLFASFLSVLVGGTLAPVLCPFAKSRFRGMIFFYSMSGAMLSVALSWSLGVSAMMMVQLSVGKRVVEYLPYVVPAVALIAGLLGGYLSTIFLNRRWKVRTNVT